MAAEMSRVERKRAEARGRILAATEALAREKSLDQITIQDITDAADVGHGSFYLHFKTKFDVLVPIIRQRAEAMDEQFQSLTAELDDPAEVMAISARLMSREIIRDPLWCWFLEHSGMPLEQMRRAFGRFSQRDLDKGLANGRFQAKDLETTIQFGFGGFINLLMVRLNQDVVETVIDDAVELLLTVLGIDREEAAVLAHRPLPVS
jgi:AcrR family transcriptional regulator